MRPESASENGRLARAILWIFLAALVLGTLALGASWGFPVQDETYLIRLLRSGYLDRLVAEHPDRPATGWLISVWARLAGERAALYIPPILACWALMAAAVVALWKRLFPEWERAAPVAALLAVAPVVTQISFTSVTTLFVAAIPVLLVLAALFLMFGRGGRAPTLPACVAAVVLVAVGGLVSEYALATAAGAAALLFVLQKRREPVLLLVGGVGGYLGFRALADVSLRVAQDPDIQAVRLFERLSGLPLKMTAAVWSTVIGGWAEALSTLELEWTSRSTLVAAAAGIAAAAAAIALLGRPGPTERVDGLLRRLVALAAAVFFSLLPSVLIQGWPRHYVFESRYGIPVVAFASCLTLALLMAVTRSRGRRIVLFVLVFFAIDRLVAQAFAEKRLQQRFERLGERLLPIVRESEGAVLVVMPPRTSQTGEEMMGKATHRWPLEDAERLWIKTPDFALPMLGPRSACRSLDSVKFDPTSVRWHWRGGKLARVLWYPAIEEADAFEPYYRGCPDQEGATVSRRAPG